MKLLSQKLLDLVSEIEALEGENQELKKEIRLSRKWIEELKTEVLDLRINLYNQ